MHDATLTQLEHLFLSLSDKTRLRLLGLMAGGEVSVGYLADALGESQPKISRHLAYLRNAGLVSTRRDGKWIYYGIDVPSNETAANVLHAALGSAMPRNETLPAAVPAIEGVGSHDAREEEYQQPIYEEPMPTEPDYVDDWRPEELEIHLL